MIRIFRHNTVWAAIFTVLLALVLRIPVLIHAEGYETDIKAPLSSLFFTAIDGLGNGIQWRYIIATVITCLQALLLNYLFVKHEVLYKATFLPGFIFVVLSSLYIEQMQLTPHLISNTFLLLLLLRLFYLYESFNPLLLALDAGLYIGCGFLFYYEFILFVPFVLISVVIFTSFNVRFILITLLGFLLPVYAIATYYFVTDQFAEAYASAIDRITSITIQNTYSSFLQLMPLVVIILPLIGGAYGMQQHYFMNKVKTRRVLQSILLLGVFGLIALFIESKNFIYATLYLNVSLTMPIAYYFIGKQRTWLKEGLIWTLIGISVYFSTMNYLYAGGS